MIYYLLGGIATFLLLDSMKENKPKKKTKKLKVKKKK